MSNRRLTGLNVIAVYGLAISSGDMHLGPGNVRPPPPKKHVQRKDKSESLQRLLKKKGRL